MIERSLEQYERKKAGLIKKVATPWNIQRNERGEIFRAFPLKKSTVDYIGVFHGAPVAFEAKSTQIETRFPLDNIEEHQIKFLRDWEKQGGLAFLLFYFTTLETVYFMTIAQLDEFMETNKRKSIPLDYFKKYCQTVGSKNGVIVNFEPLIKGFLHGESKRENH